MECATAHGFPPELKQCRDIVKEARVNASDALVASLHKYWLAKRAYGKATAEEFLASNES